MLDLVWDETDFLTVLEVEPQVDTDDHRYLYVVEKDGLRLELCVFPYEGDILIFLYKSGKADPDPPVLSLTLAECPGARRIKDERGEFLEIAGAQLFGGRYQAESAIPFGVRLSVNPDIRIELI